MRKMDNKNTGGIGATGLLGVAFIVLKLCHVIEWSWLWVLSPFWISLGIAIIVIIIYVMFQHISKKR